MEPIILVIPTFGTYLECYHARGGYKPAEAKYSAQSGDKDDLDGWDSPNHRLLECEEG
jgi:hypothetical protein